jgi:antitoxin component YwqK of YwqJK toxin-antitoxin module
MRSGSFNADVQIGVWRTFDREGKLVKETDFGAGK